MKRLNKLNFGYILLISLLFIQCKKDYSITNVTGTYVNRNFKYEPFIPEIPYVSDTLVLNNDSTFTSKFWGKGTYEIKNSLVNSSIELHYKYEFGKASYRARIEQDNNKYLKIILFEEKNHFYEKID